jgi:hypothetical protein
VLLLLKGSGVEVVRLVLGRRSVLRRAGRNGKQRGEELVVGSFAVVLVDVGRLGAKCQRRSGREGKGRKSSVEEGVEGSRRPRRLVGGSVGGGEIGRSWVDVRIGRFRWGETRWCGGGIGEVERRSGRFERDSWEGTEVGVAAFELTSERRRRSVS